MRVELLEGWQPRNSIERLLVDTLMQVQSQYEHWLEVLTGRTTMRAPYEKSEDEEVVIPPRLTDSEAIEQAAAMVDRFHRIMMRTIRQLQNLRRPPPVVMVQNASQVNVGQQQVNAVPGGGVYARASIRLSRRCGLPPEQRDACRPSCRQHETRTCAACRLRGCTAGKQKGFRHPDAALSADARTSPQDCLGERQMDFSPLPLGERGWG
jgi:hypothetical protein